MTPCDSTSSATATPSPSAARPGFVAARRGTALLAAVADDPTDVDPTGSQDVDPTGKQAVATGTEPTGTGAADGTVAVRRITTSALALSAAELAERGGARHFPLPRLTPLQSGQAAVARHDVDIERVWPMRSSSIGSALEEVPPPPPPPPTVAVLHPHESCRSRDCG